MWRYVRIGFYARSRPPRWVQRYRCDSCCRRFSDQTFQPTYWLRRGELLGPVLHRLVGCSGFRQIAREFRVSPQTVGRLSARLGRHCLLWHVAHRPRGICEPLALDSFESYEWSQYYPTSYHVTVGARSHFFYGFTDSECRRRGRMTKAQKRQRSRLEASLGRPDPRAIEKEVASLLEIVASDSKTIELHTDEHTDYPRALRRVAHVQIEQHTVSSRAARTVQNPLFPINLLDLLIRHSGANHKRETIAASKRRASAAERLFVFAVWRNWMKPFSEKRRGATPAMRLGLVDRCLGAVDILRRRLFPSLLQIPGRWRAYYDRTVLTRALPRCARHDLTYAY